MSCDTNTLRLNCQNIFPNTEIPSFVNIQKLGYIFINDYWRTDKNSGPNMDSNNNPTNNTDTTTQIRKTDNMSLRQMIYDHILDNYDKLYYLNTKTPVSKIDAGNIKDLLINKEKNINLCFNNSRAVFIPYRVIKGTVYYNIFLEAYATKTTPTPKWDIPDGSGLSLIISESEFNKADYKIVSNSLTFYKNDLEGGTVGNWLYGYNPVTSPPGDSYRDVPWNTDDFVSTPSTVGICCPGVSNCIDDAKLYHFTCFGYIKNATELTNDNLNLNMMVKKNDPNIPNNHPSHPDHPQKQATHDQHTKSDDKLALGLGLGLGLGLPILLVVIYFIYKYRMK